jgi:hypothetical protein
MKRAEKSTPSTWAKRRASSKLARPVAQPMSSARSWRPQSSLARSGQSLGVVGDPEVARPVVEVEYWATRVSVS